MVVKGLIIIIERSYTEYIYKDIERETETDRERENNQHVDT